ncbi:MAG TPA: hypothetical protein VEY08_11305, partial [Chloroflexia bacterium]|nr:hypothetical protein [Chloroflexia bacterium]
MDGVKRRSNEETQHNAPRKVARARVLSLATGIAGLVFLVAGLLVPLLVSGSIPAHAGAPRPLMPGAGQGPASAAAMRGAARVDPVPTETPNRQATAASKVGKVEEARQFEESGQPDQDAGVSSELTGASSLLADATPEEATGPDSNKPGAGDAASATPEETRLPDPETKPAGPGVAALTNAPERNNPHAPLAVLYNQDNSVGSASITSQNFEPSRNGLDSQAADDFVVPANTTWQIDQVQV